MHADTRLWMYRKGEARLFGHPGEVPDGEGWGRFPNSGDGISTEAEPLDSMPRRRLVELAAECGLQVEPGWTKARLRQALGEVLHDYGA